ncbi:MAG TPA: response regulator [Magnetospirillaceae bacterium]|jgi:PAS domain S-box-containing protein
MAPKGRRPEDADQILIAEDSRTQAEQLRFILEDHGYIVRAAANGREALLSARAEPPHLVISDINMPEMDGYEFCRTLKEDSLLRDVPFMLVTTLSSPHDVIHGLECGADNFITKPYDEDFLIARIRYLLTNNALRGTSKVRTGIEIDLSGKRHFITAERQQVLDLLISTYATAVKLSEEAVTRGEKLRESYETMAVLHRSAEQLNRASDEKEVVAEALERIRDLNFVEAGWIMLTRSSGEVRQILSTGLTKEQVADLARLSTCSCQRDALRGGITAATNVHGCERMPEIATHATVPLVGQQGVFGVLAVLHKESSAFAEEELRVLSALGNQVAAALDRAYLNATLERKIAERTEQLRHEIVERQAAESATAAASARLERALRASSAGIWEVNYQTERTYYSPRFMSLLGYEEQETEKSIGFLLDNIHPEDRPGVVGAVETHVQSQSRLHGEFRVRMKDGEYRWFSASGEVTREQADKPLYLSGSITDISERRRVEEQLFQAQKMEAIGNLTGGIAHDFNNILAIVIGNLDLLTMEIADGSEARALVDTAISASLKGSELTKSLLAFSRRQPLQPKMVSINKLLNDGAKMLSRAIGETIDVQLNLAEGLWSVSIDPSLLESALLNMMVNARDAMPNGGHIIIETRNTTLDAQYASENAEVIPGDYVVLEVSDDGSGMTPDVLRRVFEPFFTTKEKGKGTGLGMAMVFGFVKQSGGHIKIYSEVGHGTTIRIYLPRAARDASVRTVDAQASRSTKFGLGETVLVVEDNVAVRKAVAKQLSGAGYRVQEAEAASAALTLLERDPDIRLIFSDVIMPGAMTGADLAREVKRRWPAIRILLTSGFPEGLLENGNKIPDGINLLSKPYRMEELFTKMREVIDAQ